MATITKPNTFSAGSTIVASEHNANFDTIYNDYNGNITNANVSASASIDNSKLNLSSVTQAVALAGGLTMSSKQIDTAKGANVTSAATTTIWVTDGNFIHITGSTGPITSFGTASQSGIFRVIVFDSTPTITHNATSLILPTGANIVAAAGDAALVFAETTANARVIGYWRKDGTPLVSATAATALSGSVIQKVSTETGAVATGTTVIPFDDTIPQITEGDQYMTLAITPNNASNTLEIVVVAHFSQTGSGSRQTAVALFQDSTADALAAVAANTVGGGTFPTVVTFVHHMTAGTTSSTTFRVRIGAESGQTISFNGNAGTRILGGVAASSITIREYKA